MPEIDILLAAYNGEKFIAEQIDSILGQTFQDFRLLIRDDGSSDNTPAIIEEYARKFPGKIEIVHDDVVCKNPYKNFMELLKHAKADYVMFSDQDDVWLPYKIQVTLWHMKKAERENPGVPVLVFCGLEVVDAKLNTMDKFLSLICEKHEYEFTGLIISGVVLGCTFMFNRELYEHCGYDSFGWGHDTFIANYAALFGVIEHVPAAMVLYRQHDHNVSGYMNVGGGGNIVQKWIRKLGKLRKADIIRRKCQKVREIYGSRIPPDRMKALCELENLISRNRLVRIFMMLTGKYPLRGRFIRKLTYFVKLVCC